MQESINAFHLPELRANSIPFVTAYDGGEGESETPAAPATPPKKEENGKYLQMTQEQLDAIVEARLARQKNSLTDEFKSKEAQAIEQVEQLRNGIVAEKQQLINELEEFRSKFQGTEAEKQQLKQRIDALKNEQLSAEEQAAQRIAELEEKLNQTQSTLQEQVELHKNSFANYRIEQELRNAAVANNALVPEQLITLLRPQTVAVPTVNEQGQEVPGSFEVKTKVTVYDKNGEPEALELTPAEAIAKLKEDVDRWGNQFSGESKSGAGLTNQKGKAGPDGLIIDKGYEAYKKSRSTDKGRSQLGINAHNRYVRNVKGR